MKARELELCQIQRWYPRFKALSLKTIILPLPECFISYLQEDGLFLPRDSQALPVRQRAGIYDDDDYHRWDEEDDETNEPEAPSFPQLEAEVASSIAKLDGSVFPKLNWSAPKDSAWISSNGNLRCTNFGEICLLLKASDSLVHDLSHAFDSCDDKTSHRPPEFFLALRKWYDMRPEMEFRGFVRHGLLVGVSQREVTGFYPALLESQEIFDASVVAFFVDNLSEAFELEDYTFDCYITRAGKVKLVDFNPWGAFTLPLLFTWDELEGTYVKFKAALSSSVDDMHLLVTCKVGESSSIDDFGSSYEGGRDSIKDCRGCRSIEICTGEGVVSIKDHYEAQVKSTVNNVKDDIQDVVNKGDKGSVNSILNLEEEKGNENPEESSGGVHCIDVDVHLKEEREITHPADKSHNDSDASSQALFMRDTAYAADKSHNDSDASSQAHFMSQYDDSRSLVEEVVNSPEAKKVLELMDTPSFSAHMKNNTRTIWGKLANIVLREQGLKSEFRIVTSDCHVQVNLRMAGGVPYDYVQTGPGSAWDEFLRRAHDEMQQQNKDAAAGG